MYECEAENREQIELIEITILLGLTCNSDEQENKLQNLNRQKLCKVLLHFCIL